ncbi:hypothetical protein AGLY_008213 [Aphis glycines]|uniref:Uncharacterized protein n=1 Tax=Aphis glycines TaxID=307491 RepID=A0A6G0TLM9_APHGL|nr:hypothetical protein AGLY_008213 [Aphis glycines]
MKKYYSLQVPFNSDMGASNTTLVVFCSSFPVTEELKKKLIKTYEAKYSINKITKTKFEINKNLVTLNLTLKLYMQLLKLKLILGKPKFSNFLTKQNTKNKHKSLAMKYRCYVQKRTNYPFITKLTSVAIAISGINDKHTSLQNQEFNLSVCFFTTHKYQTCKTYSIGQFDRTGISEKMAEIRINIIRKYKVGIVLKLRSTDVPLIFHKPGTGFPVTISNVFISVLGWKNSYLVKLFMEEMADNFPNIVPFMIIIR